MRYEGYRSEAERIDKDLERRLFSSALDRLEEAPLRLVEVESHGSPFHELRMGAQKLKSTISKSPKKSPTTPEQETAD